MAWISHNVNPWVPGGIASYLEAGALAASTGAAASSITVSGSESTFCASDLSIFAFLSREGPLLQQFFRDRGELWLLP